MSSAVEELRQLQQQIVQLRKSIEQEERRTNLKRVRLELMQAAYARAVKVTTFQWSAGQVSPGPEAVTES